MTGGEKSSCKFLALLLLPVCGSINFGLQQHKPVLTVNGIPQISGDAYGKEGDISSNHKVMILNMYEIKINMQLLGFAMRTPSSCHEDSCWFYSELVVKVEKVACHSMNGNEMEMNNNENSISLESDEKSHEPSKASRKVIKYLLQEGSPIFQFCGFHCQS